MYVIRYSGKLELEKDGSLVFLTPFYPLRLLCPGKAVAW